MTPRPEKPATNATPQDRKDRLLQTYGHHLGPEVDERQAGEVLLALWQIMQAFVELGFSVKAGDKFGPGADIGMDDVLQYLCLEETAHETVASEKHQQKQEQP